MKKFKELLAPAVAGFVGAVVLLGGALGFGAFDTKVVLPEDFDIAAHLNLEELKGAQGDKGDRGPSGYAPAAKHGKDGKDGADGKDGVDGKNASFSLTELTDAVVEEIEDREESDTWTFSNDDGDYEYSLDISESDNYKFTKTHCGSGELIVSLEDEDGNIDTLIDTDGHVNDTDIRFLNREDYIIHVSADGDWKVKVEQK